MGSKYAPFKRTIISTLVAGILSLSSPKISRGDIMAKVNLGKDPSVGVQYSMRFGKTKSSSYKNGKYSLETKVDENKSTYSDEKVSEQKIDHKYNKFGGFGQREFGDKNLYGSNLSGFVWGLTRPFQLYGNAPNKGFQFYPFLSKPFKVGGIFSPFTKEAWKRKNLAGTIGTVVSEIAIITAGLLSSKKKDNDSSNNENTSQPDSTNPIIPPEDDPGHGGDPY